VHKFNLCFHTLNARPFIDPPSMDIPIPAQPRQPFRDVWLVAAGHALTHWYPATFYLLLPLIGNELGLNYGEIGMIMTCQAVAGALTNIPGGILADTVGKKGMLMALSLAWVGVPYFVMGFAHNYWMILLCVIMVGVGNNLWHPTAISLLASRYKDKKGLVLSLHGMGGNVGDAVAPLVIGALLISFSWRQIIMVNVVPGVVMAGLILANLGALSIAGKKSPAPSGPGQAAGGYRDGLRALLKNRVLMMLSVSGAFRSMTQTTLLTFLPVFLANEMKYPAFWVGACMFILQAAGFAAAPIAGHLSDRMGRRRIIISSMTMTGVVLLFMAVAGQSQAFVWFIAALGFFLFAIRAVLQAWLLDATPKNMGGTSIGVLFGMQAVGSTIGPGLGGLLADHYGIMSVFYFLAATIIVANLFVFFVPVPQGKATA
jgi:MFS family permease